MRPNFQNSFSQTIFSSSIQSSKLSRNMRKWRVKLRIATIYPPWGQIFKKKIKKHTPPSSEMLDLLRRWHLNRINEKNQGYFLSGALKVTILCNVSICLDFSRKWVGNHFYMAKLTLMYIDTNAGTRAPFGRSTWLEFYIWVRLHQKFLRYSETRRGHLTGHSVTQCHTVWHCVTQSDTVCHNVKLPWQRSKVFFRSSLSGDRDQCKVTKSWTMAIGGLQPTASIDRDQIQALTYTGYGGQSFSHEIKYLS